MKIAKWVVFISCLALVACQSPDPLSLTEVEDNEEIVQFVNDYKNTMVESVNNGQFNDVEPFLMANVSFYHSLRRYVDDLHNSGAKKELLEFDVEDVFEDEIGDYYVDVFESVMIEYPNDEQQLIDRYVTFEINRIKNGDLRIVTIRERKEE